ncbi:MAG: FG-GAP-like repeat-containing protein, partial [Polyangiaceae bacterium]
MSDRATRAQHDGGDSKFGGWLRGASSARTWHRLGVAMVLASIAACSGDGDTTTGGGSGASGGSGGSGGAGTTGGKGGVSGSAGSGGASGSAGAGTAGSSGKGGSGGAAGAGTGGSSGTGGATGGASGAGGSKDGGAGTGGTGGTGGTTDGGKADGSTDVSMPPDVTSDGPLPGNLTVVTVEPTARRIVAPVNAPIVINFDRPVNRTSVTNKSLWAYGRWGGPVRPSMFTFSNSDKTVSFTPPRNWPAGDRVTVVLSHDLAGADGSKLRTEGYSFQYSTATKAANQMYTEITPRLTSRTTAGTPTRTYGGSVADLNNDGFLDLLTINEDSADMRIFMNKGDGTGTYNAFVQPPTKVGNRASPSETTDFNGDGIVDIVVANLNDDTLSILFGNNNGTFTTSQTPAVAGQPRGVVVIDVDGDGDIDIVNTNADGDNMSLLINDGTGKFPTVAGDGGPNGIIFFDSGLGMATARQEFGLFAGDMNEDGILDIVVG